MPLPDQHPTEDIDSAALEPIDSDVNPHPGGLSRRGRGDATVLVAIAAGGAVGALLAVWATATTTRRLVNWRIQ